MDGVITRATHNRGAEVRVCAEDVNLVVAAATVDFDRFNIGKGGNTPCPGNEGIGNDKGVTDRCANDDNGVDTWATIDKYRSILQVVIAIGASAAKDRGKIGDFFLIFSILAQNKESLKQEPVIARTSMEIELGPVVVHLNAVILTFAKNKEWSRVAVGHVIGISYRNTFRELQSTVGCIRDKWNRAHGYIIVAAAKIKYCNRNGVVEEDIIGTTESIDLNALNSTISNQVFVTVIFIRSATNKDEAGTVRS